MCVYMYIHEPTLLDVPLYSQTFPFAEQTENEANLHSYTDY